MKKIISLLAVILVFASTFNSCDPVEEEKGSIYGVVTDKATGEPVKNANVQLRPMGETTLTGTDGRYEFADLKDGDYTLVVSKTEYTDLIDDYVITVNGGKAIRRDVQIEKIPALFRILDASGNDIEELDFGSMADDNIRLFNIFNNSTSSLDYEIYKTAAWVVNVSSDNGVLQPGATKSIVVTIDRTMLSLGNNVTTMTIVTNNGGKQLKIKARVSDGSDDDNDDENGEDPDTPDDPSEPDGGGVCVDLGLPSGLKWATCNVGATRPEEVGSYYGWGELEPKSYYDESSSPTYGQNVADISGNAQYDVATALWGNGWRMPTQADFEELAKECTWKHTKVDDIYGNDIEGQMVTGPSGKSIFFPFTGYMAWESLIWSYKAYYWTSTPDGKNYARGITFDYDAEDYLILPNYKWYGCCIRPVKK
ncbi:MAG: carboxypeptidase regulatory-like domain-containing protein [Bacteroidales bacterium]|nr:carboxypeptidase regulatory-like domain-containing protein [Bacteroidales bacterium]